MSGEVVQPSDRSSLGVLSYAAGDDEDGGCIGRVLRYAESFSLEHGFEYFRIKCVHLTAETFEIDFLEAHVTTLP